MIESLLSIYGRREGYYLVSSAKTTMGLWMHVGEPPTFLHLDARPVEIGREALACLADPRPQVAHPQRDEWREARRTSLEPLIRAAKLRSWRAFISGTTTVELGRTDVAYEVTPMEAMSKPHGSFEPVLTHQMALDAPTPADLGQAILQAFAIATPA